ncbi:Hypothetical protein IALB_0261 [Ignavibacterium album JCM 16511]|uniref:Uncharacterized protein n=1 Tax=Ignavibacterium album (strain DSM 19864 / JCM 16511 / NBRC 101810 / Mat9-16) TaxID=945713 RepID=I0AG66_IGNAJ|nr:hypothetical protein [Ignavibacterium album]AFH47973.1 Hypothetical protein IALB_0261 [Ignavibacterium album JCM 16511]
MIKKFALSTFPIFYFLILTSEIYPQFNFYSAYQIIYDDNIYNNYLNSSDLINNLQLGSAYNFESEVNNLQFYYEGVFGDYKTNKIKSFNSHKIGFVNTHLFSEDFNPLNAGINYTFRNNRDEFELYDFRQLSAYINYRQSIKETNFLLSGYIFQRNEYTNFSVFSNYEHKAFIKWISNFESQTSLMLSSEFDYKSYFDKYNFEGYANEGSFIKLHLNIGQSFSENTGGNIFLIYRKNLTDKSRYVVNDSLIYYEEEIFNDLYAFDSFDAGIGFTKIIGDEVKVSSEIRYSGRFFNSLFATDLFGTELTDLRKDDQISFGIGVEYDLEKLINGLILSATFNYIRNKSNDFYYDYSNQIFSISVDYGF